MLSWLQLLSDMLQRRFPAALSGDTRAVLFDGIPWSWQCQKGERGVAMSWKIQFCEQLTPA